MVKDLVKSDMEMLGRWSNCQLVKWIDDNGRVNFTITLSYKKDGKWVNKRLMVYPSEINGLVLAVNRLKIEAL